MEKKCMFVVSNKEKVNEFACKAHRHTCKGKKERKQEVRKEKERKET